MATTLEELIDVPSSPKMINKNEIPLVTTFMVLH
jgi:hypothetical protein